MTQDKMPIHKYPDAIFMGFDAEYGTVAYCWNDIILRSAAELFLIGTHGRPAIKNRSTRGVLLTGEWPTESADIDAIIVDTLRREHSRKPDEMIPLLENLFDGPYLELFARTTRPNWTVWGNQVDKF